MSAYSLLAMEDVLTSTAQIDVRDIKRDLRKAVMRVSAQCARLALVTAQIMKVAQRLDNPDLLYLDRGFRDGAHAALQFAVVRMEGDKPVRIATIIASRVFAHDTEAEILREDSPIRIGDTAIGLNGLAWKSRYEPAYTR